MAAVLSPSCLQLWSCSPSLGPNCLPCPPPTFVILCACVQAMWASILPIDVAKTRIQTAYPGRCVCCCTAFMRPGCALCTGVARHMYLCNSLVCPMLTCRVSHCPTRLPGSYYDVGILKQLQILYREGQLLIAAGWKLCGGAVLRSKMWCAAKQTCSVAQLLGHTCTACHSTPAPLQAGLMMPCKFLIPAPAAHLNRRPASSVRRAEPHPDPRLPSQCRPVAGLGAVHAAVAAVGRRQRQQQLATHRTTHSPATASDVPSPYACSSVLTRLTMTHTF